MHRPIPVLIGGEALLAHSLVFDLEKRTLWLRGAGTAVLEDAIVVPFSR